MGGSITSDLALGLNECRDPSRVGRGMLTSQVTVVDMTCDRGGKTAGRWLDMVRDWIPPRRSRRDFRGGDCSDGIRSRWYQTDQPS